jgi:foldase protein PrsA
MVTIARRVRAAARAVRRTPRTLAVALALGAGLITTGVVAAVAGGGGGVPAGAVATVDGEPIDESAFDHWLTVAARSSGRPGAEVPKPPDFADCVAAKRKAQPAPAKGKKGKEAAQAKTDAQLKEECRREYQDLRDRALSLLISQRWIEGEAEELGVSVTDAEVKKSFEEQRKRSFPKEADFRKWLTESGQSEEDILQRVRYDLLQTKISDRMSKGDDKVTEADIAGYYEQNKERFGEPATRDVRLVLAESRAKALRARAALERGAGWRAVVKRFSIDPSTKAQGGALRDVAEGSQEPELDEAVFKARKGRLTGPLETQFGWYVFEVTKTEPGSQQTLEEAKSQIRQLVVSERRQKRLSEYAETFRKKWRDRTECQDGYVMADCKNAAAPTPAPTMTQR